jgi:hypothetical protein
MRTTLPSDNSFQAFGESLRGELIQPGDQRYDTARKLYNGMIERWPRAIARCADVSDVNTAVRSRASMICCSPCAVEATTAAASGRVMIG